MRRLRSRSVLLAAGALVVVALAVVAWSVTHERGVVENPPEQGPAQVTPPVVALYAEALLDPPDEEGPNARALLTRLLGGGRPGDRLGDLVAARLGGGIDFERDVRPWLGDRVGVFYRSLAGPDSAPTLLLPARDTARARAALMEGPAAGAPREFRGVPYRVRAGGPAVAVVDGFAIAGAEPGVRAAIDASRSHGLADTDRYRSAVRRAKEERVGLAYFDLLAFGSLLEASGLVSEDRARELRGRLALTDPVPILANIAAKPTAAIVDFGPRPGDTLVPGAGEGNAAGGQGDGGTPPGEQGGAQPLPGRPEEGGGEGLEAGPGSGGAPRAPSAGLSLLSAPLLPELPADAWLAFSVPEFGRRAGELFDPAIDPSLPLDQLLAVARRLERDGLDLRGEVFPALGGMAVFVRGTPGDLEGGALIESFDPESSARAVDRLARVLRTEAGFRVRRSDLPGGAGGWRADRADLPAPVYLRARGNRVVVALGRDAALDTLDAPRKLGDTSGFNAAAGVLAPSLRPDAYLDLQQALGLAADTGAGRGKAFRDSRPVLAAFDYLVFAAKNRIRRFALGVT